MPLLDQLSPTQRDAHDRLVAALPAGNIFELRSKPGRGRTTVLSLIHAAKGGAFLTVRDFVDRLDKRHPLALEEALYEGLLDALREHDCVIVDDFHVSAAVMRGGCGFCPRNGLLNAPMTVVAAYASATGKRLILGGDGQLPEALSQRSYSFSISRFEAADYRHLCTGFLGENRARHLDLDKVHRFAPNLNAHQLRGACSWFQGGEVDTDRFRRLSAHDAPGEQRRAGRGR
jgi:transitional endoplasmic reticulum ATPase